MCPVTRGLLLTRPDTIVLFYLFTTSKTPTPTSGLSKTRSLTEDVLFTITKQKLD